MMDCRKYRKLIDLYLDGEADSSQTQMLFSHIEKCEKCQVRFEEYKDLHSTISSVSVVELPAGFRGSIMENIRTAEPAHKPRFIALHPVVTWGSAAAVILFILAIIMWRIDFSHEITPEAPGTQVVSESDSESNEVVPGVPETTIVTPPADVATEAPKIHRERDRKPAVPGVPETIVVPPREEVIITARSDGPKPEGTNIVITVSQTKPGKPGAFTYSFDWDNDGVYDVVDQTDPSASHTWYDDGIYTVGVRVKDKDLTTGTATTLVQVSDLSPKAEFAFTPDSQNEGSPVAFADASRSSPDTIALWSWDFGDNAGVSAERDPTYTYRDNGVYIVTLTVTDDDGSSASKAMRVMVNNVAPSVEAGADELIAGEGDSIRLKSCVINDPGSLDTHKSIIDWGDGTVEAGIVSKAPFSPSEPGAANTVAGSHIYADNGVYRAAITVTDDDGASASDVLTVVIDNQPPSVGSISMFARGTSKPVSVIEVYTDIEPGASLKDLGVGDTHTSEWIWGDGSASPGTISRSGDARLVKGRHAYDSPGVYTVTLKVTDDDGGWGESVFEYVAVFNPNAGFAAGSGWIRSPKGAYIHDTSFADKATFGFASRYDQDADIPVGNMELKFHAADMNFHSEECTWFSVEGTNAQFRGRGTINKRGDYWFMLMLIDGEMISPGDMDRFRIRIWEQQEIGGIISDSIVYDSLPGDDVEAVSDIGDGDIIIYGNRGSMKDEFALPLPLPKDSNLLASFPNPANPDVWLPYQLGSGAQVVIKIYNVSGQLVRTLDLGYKPAGFYTTKEKAAYWDGSNEAGERVASGIYFYNIQAGNFVATRKMIVTK